MDRRLSLACRHETCSASMCRCACCRSVHLIKHMCTHTYKHIHTLTGKEWVLKLESLPLLLTQAPPVDVAETGLLWG